MLQDMITQHRSAFAPGASTELRAQRSLSRRVVLHAGNLRGNTRTDAKGVSARVYKEGLYGFASAADLSDSAVKAALTNATNNASFLNDRVPLGKGKLPDIARGKLALQPDMADLPQKIYIDYLQALDSYIVGKYPDLASRFLIANCDSMEKIICTSDGYTGHIVAPRSHIYIFLNSTTNDGMPIELFRALGGSGTFDAHFDDPAKLYAEVDALYEKLMRKREGVYADAGLKTCVLGGELAGMLAHEAVGHTVEADLVLGGSVAGSMMNKPVASELVSMTDFAHTALGQAAPLPVYIDDEGVLAEDAVLIRDGILTGYMVNRETGAQLGLKPQGNARAWAFNDEPLIRMRNTAVLPGKDKLEDIIASVDDGYYLIDTGNGQADTTGEFMFSVTMGYEIKKGRLGRALFDTTITGVAFDMLKTVDMVGDEVTWTSSGFCGKKQPMPVGMGGPALRCKVTVGGK